MSTNYQLNAIERAVQGSHLIGINLVMAAEEERPMSATSVPHLVSLFSNNQIGTQFSSLRLLRIFV